MDKVDFTVPPDDAGVRLDRFLANCLVDTSRTTIQKAIRRGYVRVSGEKCTQPSRPVHPGERITWAAPAKPALSPSPLPLPIIYEDAEIVIVNKPAGVVVHPGAGVHGGTVVERLLMTRRLPVSDDPVRPGIVHRLDRETSGVLVVAKTAAALESLKHQFATRTVHKEYIAQVEGVISEDEGLIDAPIGRDPSHPRQMMVIPRGRPAQTAFRVLFRAPTTTLIVAYPHTGRTHQVRVHLRYIGHPVCGDPVYGNAGPHVLLHAWRIVFTHPRTGRRMQFAAPVPPWFPRYPYDDVPIADDTAARR